MHVQRSIAYLRFSHIHTRSDLERSRSELHVDVVVGDDRNFSSGQGHDHLTADKVFVTSVLYIPT